MRVSHVSGVPARLADLPMRLATVASVSAVSPVPTSLVG